MKNIDTLVPDILGLFRSETAVAPEIAQEFGDKIAATVISRLAEGKRQPRLRMSNVGMKCERRLWYQMNRPDRAEPIGPTAKIKFLFGDIIEQLVLFLAKAAGHTVTDEQKEVTIGGIVGHIDARVDNVLVDVKSTSSYSFSKFAAGLSPDVDDFGYLSQLDIYANADGSDTAAFIAFDKTLGKLALDKHEKTDTDWASVVLQKQVMLAEPEPPARSFRSVADGASGNMKLGVACSYCEFKHTCWPGVRTFLYSGGPRYLTEVRRTPNVQEIAGFVAEEPEEG